MIKEKMESFHALYFWSGGITLETFHDFKPTKVQNPWNLFEVNPRSKDNAIKPVLLVLHCPFWGRKNFDSEGYLRDNTQVLLFSYQIFLVIKLILWNLRGIRLLDDKILGNIMSYSMINNIKTEGSIHCIMERLLRKAPGVVYWRYFYLHEAIVHLRLKSFGGQYCIAEVRDLKKIGKVIRIL